MNKRLGRYILSAFFSNISMTTWLIFVNLIFFIIVSVLIAYNPKFVEYLALQPASILQGKYLWTLVTHMFMHANLLHLFFNMFSLYFIGTFLERIIGRKRFLVFYLTSGIVAGVFFTLLAGFFGGSDIGSRIFGSPLISGVGASGAIFGLLGVLAVLVPRSKVYLIVGPLIAIIIQSIGDGFLNESSLTILSAIVNIYIVISLLTIFSFNPQLRRISIPIEMPLWILPIIAIVPLMLIGFFVSLPIANTAHLGGLIVGLAYGIYLRKKYKKRVAFLNRYVR